MRLFTVAWRVAVYTMWHGVVVSSVRRMNEVDPLLVWLVLGLSLGGCTISVCNQPTRSTQPCIHPDSLNRVPALLGYRRECHICWVAGNTVILYGA